MFWPVLLTLLVVDCTTKSWPSNLGNRLVSPRGVTEFIDIGVASWRFWTFNLADAGITIGAALLLFVLWRDRSRTEVAA